MNRILILVLVFSSLGLQAAPVTKDCGKVTSLESITDGKLDSGDSFRSLYAIIAFSKGSEEVIVNSDRAVADIISMAYQTNSFLCRHDLGWGTSFRIARDMKSAQN